MNATDLKCIYLKWEKASSTSHTFSCAGRSQSPCLDPPGRHTARVGKDQDNISATF